MKPLDVTQVYRHCPEEAFDFEVSSELPSLDLLSGHDRAREALDFGTAMRSDGFNLYVLGHPGHGKHQLVGRFLAERSRDEPTPPDVAYRATTSMTRRGLSTCCCPPAWAGCCVPTSSS